MEILVAKPRRRLGSPERHQAFASGARSAFDLSGLGAINDKVLRPRSSTLSGPAEMIARDMARVMVRFGRSAIRARRALEAGMRVEDLKPGRTSSTPPGETTPLRTTRSH